MTDPKLALGAVTASKLAADAVDGSKVADDSLGGADVNEASLDIPQQALPTTLPPSGPAAGDLSGAYPDPPVQEAGLTAGGDLSGPLSNAQIGADTVDDAEIVNGLASIVIPASEVTEDLYDDVGEPDFDTATGFPALAFNDTQAENLDLITSLPFVGYEGESCAVRLVWSAANTGSVSWQVNFTELSPNAGETIAGATPFLNSGNTDNHPVAGELRSTLATCNSNIPDGAT